MVVVEESNSKLVTFRPSSSVRVQGIQVTTCSSFLGLSV